MPLLSAVDLAMFLLESETRPFHVGPLIVLRPPAGFRGNFADQLVKKMLKRPVNPPFNCKLELALDRRPAIVPVPDVDPAEHVHRITLKGRTGMQALFDKVCALHEVRLDRSRPLWELYVIDGLEDGRVALYGRMHHGVIDGRTFVKLLTHWVSLSPAERTVRAMWEGVPRASPPSAARKSLSDQLQALGTTAASLAKLLVARSLATAGVTAGLKLPFVEVPAILDGRLTSKRSYAYCTLPLSAIKAFGKQQQATVNDVLLTVLDIAFDRYLREQRATPPKPVVIDMPIALSGASGGNQIAMLQVALGPPGASPAQRLDAVRANTALVKREMAGQTNDAAMLFGTLAHAFPSLVERIGLGRRWKLANAVVSNPFGMTEPCYLMGAEVELVLPMSLVPPGQTLNITAVTLVDKLQIGFLAVPDAVPHVERLAKYTEAAFPALTAAFARPPKVGPRMSATGRPERQYRSAQREGTPMSAKPGRPQPPRSKIPTVKSTKASATNGRRRRTAATQ